MKNHVRNFVVLVVFAMALTGLSLAQEDTYRVNANVPFDFLAGDQQLPAGTYQFEVNYGNHSVMLRNKTSGRSYALLARPADGEGVGQAVVEFDVIGGTHLLADLDRQHGRRLPRAENDAGFGEKHEDSSDCRDGPLVIPSGNALTKRGRQLIAGLRFGPRAIASEHDMFASSRSIATVCGSHHASVVSSHREPTTENFGRRQTS